LDEQREKAYRWLLYQATLEIRPRRLTATRWLDRLNPFQWIHLVQQARAAGALADWLHNLAMYSALDFRDFDEDRFWKDYEWFAKQGHEANLKRYREDFERNLVAT